jgi:hypothetical protein
MRFDVSGSFFRAVPDGTPLLIEGFGEPYNYAALVSGTSPTSVRRSIALFTGDSASGNLTLGMYVAPDGRVGVGTGSVSARLTVQDSTGQDLIAAYSGASRVFQVTSSGEVRADGAFRGASFNTGSADVAERINTSEWVEAGNVVEIDPDHPGFFRKSTGTYSRRVAGIISEEPGVILGNNSGSQEEWDDSRPALALAGRVRVLASVENGPIRVGDLLTSSSEPGVAMRATDPEAIMGAVVGKAMEELAEGTAKIMVQVMLH